MDSKHSAPQRDADPVVEALAKKKPAQSLATKAMFLRVGPAKTRVSGGTR